MFHLYRAAWVLPIDAPPIRDGWVATDDGRVVGVGAGEPYRDWNHFAILPGLINAHTHLELSWMAGKVPRCDSMGAWIRELMALRRGSPPPEHVQRQAAADAISSARATGTIAFGDIGNSFIGADVLAEAGVASVLFHELIGFGAADARARASEGAVRVIENVRPPVRPGLAPHAPYSVSPDLFRAIADEAAAHRLPSSVHLGESPDEIEFIMTGRGEIAATLKHLGAWNESWSAPGVDPAEYLDSLGVLTDRLLVVHATQLRRSALDRLANRGCVIVSCPRSNRWVGAGDPPVDDFYASGAAVTFGTDSLASAPDLDMFAELAAARAISTVPAARLLESATLTAARALGLDADLGSITAGKRAALLAVQIPPDVDDVEEYLVRGVPEADISWLTT
ncbi:MAG TPA: amidohydrolase family protein [Vicinamibacterales bacterium]|jgi:cytosine/adenosine deaminase-related metal-dependent hydrolase